MIRKIKSPTGTGEWCTHEADIGVGCPNDCRYCYAAATANRFKDSWGMPRDQWHNYRHRPDWVDDIMHSRLMGATVMFPTKHDFNEVNWQDSARVIRHLMVNCNRVLMVTKGGHWADKVITSLCEHPIDKHLATTRLEVRVTITGYDDAMGFFEPNAPNTSGRIETVEAAIYEDVLTSVSCEPLLQASSIKDRTDLIYDVFYLCTGDVWVGKLRNLEQRVDMSKVSKQDYDQYIAPLIEMQTDENIMRLVRAFEREPRVKWKDSIREVIESGKA